MRPELWPGIYISQMELLTWFGTQVQIITPFILVENIVLVSIIILSLYTFKKGYKSTSQLFLIYIGIIVGLILVGIIVFILMFVAFFYYLTVKKPEVEPGEYKLEEVKGKK